MHFDDRLATVLRQPVSGQVIARIQYRQLVDLLGTAPDLHESPTVDAAYDRLAELSGRIPVAEREAMLRDPGLRLRNQRAVTFLAEGEPRIATAAIAAARLEEAQWLELVPALSVRSRGILRHRRDLGQRIDALLDRLGILDRGLPGSNAMPAADTAEIETLEPLELTETASPQPQGEGSIGDIVKRIEAFRKTRKTDAAPLPGGDPAPRLPLDDGFDDSAPPPLSSFDFQTDPGFCITWAGGDAAAMVIGMPLASSAKEDGRTPGPLAALIRQRQPIRSEAVSIEGARRIAGEWLIDAFPQFDKHTGSFTGYAGRARRLVRIDVRAERARLTSDRMRQILHELRNPTNAIQISAEAIQYKVLGDISHDYRALGARIAGDIAHVMAGFDELDRLVKLDAGQLEVEAGESDFSSHVLDTIDRLRAYSDTRDSGFEVEAMPGLLRVPVDSETLDRMLWRLLGGLAGASAPGERLRLRLRLAGIESDTGPELEIALPSALADRTGNDIFIFAGEDRPQALTAGVFGTGFTMRLAAAEIRAAGGAFDAADGTIRISLPGLTEAEADHSPEAGRN